MKNDLIIVDNILGDKIGKLETLSISGSDQDIVDAARVSYDSESRGEEKDKKLLFYLWKNKHLSPFEMATLKFKVKTPVFVARQWMRHRLFSYNEISRRYTSEDIKFYYPVKWRKQDYKNKQGSLESEELDHKVLTKQLTYHNQASLDLYHAMLSDGVSREMARMVLPVNLYTSFIVSGNLRSWLHFVKLRSDEHAQWEIQQYSNWIYEVIILNFPWTYGAILKHGMGNL